MDNTPTNPVIVALFFVARCLVPLLLMLGISYLLKKLGLIPETPKPPEKEKNNHHNNQNGKGGLAHA